MEQQLQQQAAAQHNQVRTIVGGGDEPMGSPTPEAEQAQMAALAAMRAAAAGLQRVTDSPMSDRSSGGEDEGDEDDNEDGEEHYKDMMGSDEEEQMWVVNVWSSCSETCNLFQWFPSLVHVFLTIFCF